MKRIILAVSISLVMLLTLSLNVGAVEIEDVPEDHWAYESVQTLVERGYISLYEDDTFAGSNRVSRYELAHVIANLLEDIHVGETEIEEEDVDLLRQLSLEFRNELVDVAEDMELFEERVAELEEESVVQGEEVASIYESMSEVEMEVTNIIDEIARLSAIEDQVDGIETRVNELDDKFIDFEETVSSVEEGRTDVPEDFEMNINSRLDSVDSRLTSLEENQTANEEQIQELRQQNSNYMMYLGVVALIALITI
ncbi:MAG: S-layer homology domain-containing protein [Bacillota bacterium]